MVNEQLTPDRRDEGSIGIGAMIVFIALILVAAVASTIIIKTAEELQQSAILDAKLFEVQPRSGSLGAGEADAEATGGRHTYLQGRDEVFVQPLSFQIPSRLAGLLGLQALALIHRISELTEGIGMLTAHDEQLKPFHQAGFAAVRSGQR